MIGAGVHLAGKARPWLRLLLVRRLGVLVGGVGQGLIGHVRARHRSGQTICHLAPPCVAEVQQQRKPNASRAAKLRSALGVAGLAARGRNPAQTLPTGRDQIVEPGMAAFGTAQDFLGDALTNRMMLSVARFSANLIERGVHGGQGPGIKFAFDHLSAPEA